MQKLLMTAVFVATIFTTVPAFAQGVYCLSFTTCSQAYNTCKARRTAGMVSATDCQAAVASCNRTCVWNGVNERGPFTCRMRTPCIPAEK
jgi:hypothetical protein